MKTKTNVLAAIAVSAFAIAAPAANAGTTYLTTLDWGPSGHNSAVGGFGTVTVEQVDANDLRVTVHLGNNISFTDNGNAHVMFGFNLFDAPESTVTLDTVRSNPAITNSMVSYQTAEVGDDLHPDSSDFKNSPFGYFDDRWQINNPASVTLASPFVFNINNTSGITFAGTNAVFDSVTGKLITPGTIGNRLFSNSDGSVTGSPTGGWWFSVDTGGSGSCSNTCAVAGRDAYRLPGVPEPATWAMMILGMGGAGAVLRRRRKAMVAFA